MKIVSLATRDLDRAWLKAKHSHAAPNLGVRDLAIGSMTVVDRTANVFLRKSFWHEQNGELNVLLKTQKRKHTDG